MQQQRLIDKLVQIRNSPGRYPSPSRIKGRGNELSSDEEPAIAAAPAPRVKCCLTKQTSTPSYRKGSPRRSPRTSTRRSTRKFGNGARRKLDDEPAAAAASASRVSKKQKSTASFRKGSPHAQRQSPRKRPSTPASGGDESPPKVGRKSATPRVKNSVAHAIKRSNSLTRSQKTPEEQTIRKRICSAMYIFDNRFKAGDFWDSLNGCFDKDEFEVEATPLIDDLVGENVQAAGLYWDICLDVVKRRRRYLLKKQRKKEQREAAPVKVKTTANGVKGQTTTKGNPNPNPNPNPNAY